MWLLNNSGNVGHFPLHRWIFPVFELIYGKDRRCTRKTSDIFIFHLTFSWRGVYYSYQHGVLAQLARAPHWQCGGQEFKSPILHHCILYGNRQCTTSVLVSFCTYAHIDTGLQRSDPPVEKPVPKWNGRNPWLSPAIFSLLVVWWSTKSPSELHSILTTWSAGADFVVSGHFPIGLDR